MSHITAIHSGQNEPIGDLRTVRVMPTTRLHSLDPFLFLNHHGPQIYRPNNQGLPFGPHPHRGFETLTFVVSGDILHQDSTGYKSVINPGGVQWMTAGKGIIHSENASDAFRKNGGETEILQLWMNLSAKNKMTSPAYVGLEKEQIPTVSLDDGKVNVQVISGKFEGTQGPIDSLESLTMTRIDFMQGGSISLNVPEDNQIFFYVVKGSLTVDEQSVSAMRLVQFDLSAKQIQVLASENAILLFGYGKPLHEPVVSHGPFVMNTQQEIMQAIWDYQAGKFGVWKEN